MSNYALQSNLMLSKRISQAQQINRELRGELSTITSGVSNANKELNDYNSKIKHLG